MEWVTNLISGLPSWIGLPLIILVTLAFWAGYIFLYWPEREEWWQDRAKRLEKQSKNTKNRRTSKKGK